LDADVVGIGEAGLLAADRAYAHTLLDGVRTVLDDAVLDSPALAPAVLEIQGTVLDARPHQPLEGPVQGGKVQAARRKQAMLGQRERIGEVIGHGNQVWSWAGRIKAWVAR